MYELTIPNMKCGGCANSDAQICAGVDPQVTLTLNCFTSRSKWIRPFDKSNFPPPLPELSSRQALVDERGGFSRPSRVALGGTPRRTVQFRAGNLIFIFLHRPSWHKPKEFTVKLFAKSIATAAICLAFVAPTAHAAQDMKQMMQKGHEKMMSMPMTGNADVDFAMAMREHHLSAVEMAQWQLDHGKDKKLKEMARKIITDQKKEIAQFDQFLANIGDKQGGTAKNAAVKDHGDGHGQTPSK